MDDTLNATKTRNLIFSIILDVLGMASYVLPGFGESIDFVFAPLYGITIFLMYRQHKLPALVGGGIGLLEELSPGADLVPTATLMWMYTYGLRKYPKHTHFKTMHSKDV